MGRAVQGIHLSHEALSSPHSIKAPGLNFQGRRPTNPCGLGSWIWECHSSFCRHGSLVGLRMDSLLPVTVEILGVYNSARLGLWAIMISSSRGSGFHAHNEEHTDPLCTSCTCVDECLDAVGSSRVIGSPREGSTP